jgi:ubiquinone/menaquinone biosynthesis C-methylase UbiE
VSSARSAGGTQRANISRQRRFWNERAQSWDHGAQNNPGLVKVVERVIAEAAPTSGMTVVDIGCGSGQLTLRVAPMVERVLGVDISQAMIDLLMKNATTQGITNVEGIAMAMEHLEIPESSVDLVISNYVLHHLRDRDKAAAVVTATKWLKPGGRLVIGDMMFGRGTDARDREIISSKVALMIKKGPAGWWRIAKNATRYLLRFQERPVSIGAWVEMFRAAGLHEVVAIPVVNEASVVRGTRMPSDQHLVTHELP